jgi:hypothetical protein
MVSTAVETAAPDDVAPLPVLASALIAALRAALLLALAAAAMLAEAVAAIVEALAGVTVPPGAFDCCVPEAPPPDVAT